MIAKPASKLSRYRSGSINKIESALSVTVKRRRDFKSIEQEVLIYSGLAVLTAYSVGLENG